MMLVLTVVEGGRHSLVLSSSEDEDLSWAYYAAPGSEWAPLGAREDEDLAGLIEGMKQEAVWQAGDLVTLVDLELWLIHPMKVCIYRVAKHAVDGEWVDLKPPEMTWAEFLWA